MNETKSLLAKYSIPVEHLDFDYIKTCEKVRELEKILEILKSGEEGYYPDLTKFAEEKLQELDPDNCMLRIEVRCLTTGTNERQQINEFIRNVKNKDRKIRVEARGSVDDELPPVRTASKPIEVLDTLKTIKSNNSQRIGSFDYNQWEKYDADTECLKIDLHDEQIRERSCAEQKKNRQNQSKLIEVLSEETIYDNITDDERHELADKHRIKGNESFKCSEYQFAILEYTKSLSYAPTAAVYNNRAVAYLKQKMYNEAIQDCDKCLQIEATNVKAMLRKCDALIACHNKNEAYRLYMKLLQIDPENVIAKKALKNISIRLDIQDVQQPNMSTSCDQSLNICTIDGNDNNPDHKVYDGIIIPKKSSYHI